MSLQIFYKKNFNVIYIITLKKMAATGSFFTFLFLFSKFQVNIFIMFNKIKPLKYIFSNCFFMFWRIHINKFLHCSDITFGFSKFVCPHCDKIYAENWATQLFNVPHVHMTLSLPKGSVRNFFFKIDFF